jgi:excisionase family DNA binding protein
MALCNPAVMNSSSQVSPVLTIEEAGQLLKISRQSAYQAARTGELPVIRIGRRILVPRARLLALLGEPLEGNGAELPAPIADTAPESGAPAHGSG